MAQKNIVRFGDPILRKAAKPVSEITTKTLTLLDDMADTLYATDDGAGLAAPQVGILRRIVVMDCGEGLIELINPEIIKARGKQVGPEACLSFPKFTGLVKRANYVKIKSLNRKGEEFSLEAKGFLARCIQHEIDHLNGILFIDHVQGNELYHQISKKKINLLDVIRLSHGNKRDNELF
ncbi:peptide deformylase [Aneurinibacillus sp. REN35]|uniref:peptide deformylase n=1 Tax=Aneurinibacillus sp. REN35 TaxID=3237286 RepID=UPI00352813C2